MDKVYLVWRDTRELDGVFATREGAEQYITEELSEINFELDPFEYRSREMFYIEECKVFP
jgi:hypothetical protein